MFTRLTTRKNISVAIVMLASVVTVSAGTASAANTAAVAQRQVILCDWHAIFQPAAGPQQPVQGTAAVAAVRG